MKINIIGAGVSGLFTAIWAKRNGYEVTLFEKNARPARKLMITGKGRCNVTNLCSEEEFIKNVVTNGRFLYSAIHAFNSQNTIDFFESQGLKLKLERGNRIFPQSDKAVDVVDTLINTAKKSGCKFVFGDVTSLITENSATLGVVCKNKQYFAGKTVICTGGMSYPLTGSTGDGYGLAQQAGHTVTPLKPSLVPLVSDDGLCAQMQGLSLKNVKIKVKNSQNKIVFEDFGELLFTHFGLSGPLILSASGHMKNIEQCYTVSIDLKPALSEKQLDTRLQKDFLKYSNRDFINSLGELLPQKMIEAFVSYTKIPPQLKANQISKQMRLEIIGALKNFSVCVKEFRPIDEAIITSGGVNVNEINPKTMGSKISNGLYFAGEVIDVDAYTGGFNLQIAFSTGYLAGQAD